MKGIYLSEKATLLSGYNQYIFKTFANTNKSEAGKMIEKLFNVKVKAVKILNMPQKRKDVGKHSGFRAGFKKAVVVLEKGYTIEQAKP
ncbi:MAG: 50S ribosomal protein L23 [Candidatus Yanofskybacteria bacterium RIFCSPHIGHO2_01_FULL_45_42]|uniref:50S ribosomal protein L23 n=3 Tax=Candidatus Yanofskyibacteriota TaxID=1752733 RepID=A0A1F8H5X6_9BACT|nr:MAG: 50S ribosomal protein L23 [Candidatus Yanofskybacteria bacterium RIFCSPHIGHO2_01_FULL_45_42]OGN16405.1 MAG: 50S ribosomal protein L23 [Candidatus Yanofskybacteria bacterium RIFCSPHIGHO2_02_FULL_46_19]OGN27013.1 MAG: 50S ribosomal protein L23 [Candidatus Yanofskybacteria bacterium RIFCSPLOWO2_01_FULL_45_72]OGN32428.1 MAG: 50S ribosomal protein L23 [Candidatus Yanofskybacteria bacterium RIFCSPLOWO2_02_FULL_45_18]